MLTEGARMPTAGDKRLAALALVRTHQDSDPPSVFQSTAAPAPPCPTCPSPPSMLGAVRPPAVPPASAGATCPRGSSSRFATGSVRRRTLSAC